jgi:hypothetical protein
VLPIYRVIGRSITNERVTAKFIARNAATAMVIGSSNGYAAARTRIRSALGQLLTHAVQQKQACARRMMRSPEA